MNHPERPLPANEGRTLRWISGNFRASHPLPCEKERERERERERESENTCMEVIYIFGLTRAWSGNRKIKCKLAHSTRSPRDDSSTAKRVNWPQKLGGVERIRQSRQLHMQKRRRPRTRANEYHPRAYSLRNPNHYHHYHHHHRHHHHHHCHSAGWRCKRTVTPIILSLD